MSTWTFDDIWQTDGVVAGYTTDFGGSFRYNDPEDEGHYAAVGGAYGLGPGQMVRVRQVHGDRVVVVDAANGGEGIIRNGRYGESDGMVSASKGLMLCLVAADCVPVFLHDEAVGAIGLVHSGREGTGKEIAAVAVRRLEQRYGSRPQDIRCILGPSLCAAHHEVELRFAAPFAQHFTSEEQDAFITRSEGKAYIDMAGAIRLSLLRSGLREQNIHDCGICTYERRDLFSWRREPGIGGRILSFIVMTG